jgi:hypothetical protein
MATAIDTSAARAVLAVGLASASRTLDGWSRLFAGLALLGLMLPAPSVPFWKPLLCFILLAGLGQLYYATRIAFDRPILAFWAERWHDAITQPDTDLAAFDLALEELGLRKMQHKTRDLTERLFGLRRLERYQSGLLALQALAIAALCGLALCT